MFMCTLQREMFKLSRASGLSLLAAMSIAWLCVEMLAETFADDASSKVPRSNDVIFFHTAQFELGQRSMLVRFTNDDQQVIQTAEFGKGKIPEGRQPDVSLDESSKNITFTWLLYGSVTIHYIEHKNGMEYQIEWTGISSYSQLVDRYLMSGSHWYGAAQIRHQQWPIEKWVRREMPYIAGDSFHDQYGGVQDRYWLSSKGFAVHVSHDIPLFVSMNYNNDKTLSLISKWSSPYNNLDQENVMLSYRVFISSDVRTVHELATGQVFRKPISIPDELIFRRPIWSTWARYKRTVDQDHVLDFANEIKLNNFTAAQIEIDDDWTPHYGDMKFDTKKFPDPLQMVEDLKDLGFRVTIWVHPFCAFFTQCSSKPYWVNSWWLSGYTFWWGGIGRILDVTNPDAVKWFKRSLLDLKEKYNLTSFKFDGGEVNWLPFMSRPEKPWKNPNVYTTKYAEMCYESDPNTRALEVRVGVQTQHLPIFVRMMDKESNWGFNNGLKSLIPHALTFSVLGYPFILPDMIGGNAYDGAFATPSDIPEKELYIRWLQVNVFLPSLQFSISPWQYGKEVSKICRDLTELHEKYADRIISLAKESTENGAPIIRPLWWIAPKDEYAQNIDDQFLLGNDILVAPVLNKGANSRDIYLPPGIWYDELRKRDLEGGRWYLNYTAELHELPYFTRLRKERRRSRK